MSPSPAIMVSKYSRAAIFLSITDADIDNSDPDTLCASQNCSYCTGDYYGQVGHHSYSPIRAIAIATILLPFCTTFTPDFNVIVISFIYVITIIYHWRLSYGYTLKFLFDINLSVNALRKIMYPLFIAGWILEPKCYLLPAGSNIRTVEMGLVWSGALSARLQIHPRPPVYIYASLFIDSGPATWVRMARDKSSSSGWQMRPVSADQVHRIHIMIDGDNRMPRALASRAAMPNPSLLEGETNSFHKRDMNVPSM